jgi:transposase
MSERDYNRQAAKHQRNSKTTLIVGVDVGNAFNVVGFMNKDGKVLGICGKLYNSREGFEKFVEMIEGLKARHRLRDVLIGMEPTGHYGRKLAYFAKEHGEGYTGCVISYEHSGHRLPFYCRISGRAGRPCAFS